MGLGTYLADLDRDRAVCYALLQTMIRLNLQPPSGNIFIEYWFFEKRFGNINE
jgi:hypothetical protein